MNFDIFIKKVYKPKDACQIIVLLQSWGYYDEITCIARDFYEIKNSGERKNRKREVFMQSAAKTAVLVSHWLRQIEDNDKHESLLSHILRLMVLMATDSLLMCRLQLSDVFNDLNQLLSKDEFIGSRHKSTIVRFFDLTHAECIKAGDQKSLTQTAKRLKAATGVVYVIKKDEDAWKLSFRFFIDAVMHLFPRLKNRQSLEKFFSGCNEKFKITIPYPQFLLFVIMVYELHECGRIKCIRNRGLFKFAKLHLQSDTGQKLTHWKDWAKYFNVIKKDAVLYEKNLKRLNPILDRFGASKKIATANE